MKIEIHNTDSSASSGYKIYLEGKSHPERNMRRNIFDLHNFDDDEIENLLGEREYKKFTDAGKHQFNVSKSQLDLITGQRSARNKSELLMYP